MKLLSTKCAICQRDNSKELYPANFSPKDLNPKIFSARRLPDCIHYRIVCCKKCGLVYSNPTLPASTIFRLYKKSQVTYEEQENDLKKTYGRYINMMTNRLSVIPSPVRQPADRARDLLQQTLMHDIPRRASRRSRDDKDTQDRLLEVGCGNGFFLKYLKEQGWRDVWGVEPSKKALKQALKELQKRIKNDILRTDLFPKKTFDFICTFQTLDHITDPNAFLRICHKLLKPRGKILAINHDVDSWSAKLLGERSPIIDIEHIYLFNKKTLRKIFEQNGFTVEYIFTVIDRHRLSYWVRMLSLPKSFKISLLQFLTATHIGNLPIIFPAGNIGIIAKKT